VVVERVALLRAGPGSEGAAARARACDDLWGLQYRARGVLCASAGPGSSGPAGAPEAFSHGVHHRFKDWEALRAFEADPAVAEAEGALEAGALVVRWEGRIENDIFPLFQRGDAWDAGLERLLVLGGAEGLAEGAARNVEALLASADLAPLIQRVSHGRAEPSGGLSGEPPFGSPEAYAVLLRCRAAADLDAVTGHPGWRAVAGEASVSGALDFTLNILPVEGAENVM